MIDVMDLMQLLPSVYEKNITMQELQRIVQHFLEEFEKNKEKVLNNLFMSRSDELMIERYEAIFGINRNSIESSKIRAEALTARLRGATTCTLDLIKRMAESYFSDVVITENNTAYTFNMSFKGSLDQGRLLSLHNRIAEVRPAHISYTLRHKHYNEVQGLYIGSCVQITYRMEV